MQKHWLVYGTITLIIGVIAVIFFARGLAIDIPVSHYFFTSPCESIDPHQCWLFSKSNPHLSFWLHKVPNRLFLVMVIVLAGIYGASFFISRLVSYQLPLAVVLASMALGPGIVSLLKFVTGHFCPNQMAVFKGILGNASATYYPRPLCFPASHPSPGFALMALAFAPVSRGWRMAGGVIGGVLGVILAYIQLARGEHYISHVLASLTIAICVGVVIRMVMEWQRMTRLENNTKNAN